MKTTITGIRPGEKLHEVLISEEECRRTSTRGNYFVVRSILPELHGAEPDEAGLDREFSSADHLMTLYEVRKMMTDAKLIIAVRKDERRSKGRR